MTRFGDRNSNWRGGRRRSGQGMRYWVVYAPEHPNSRHGVVLEHRLVMEAHLGRYLSSDEIVHHINEDPSDNRIENLEVMTQAEHARLHLIKNPKIFGHKHFTFRRVDLSCEQCGEGFTATTTRESKQRFCSRECYWAYRKGRSQLAKGQAA